VFIVV